MFDDSTITVEADVSDFGLAWFSAVVNAAVDSETASDATAKGDVKDGVETGAGAADRFAERSAVGVVLNKDRPR